MVALILLLVMQCPPAEKWQGGRLIEGSSEARRKEHLLRFQRALLDLGLDKEARDVAVTLVWNESRFDGCAIHKLGRGEWGRGMGGHSVALHLRDKWGPGPEEMLHYPEVTAVVLARTFRRHRKATWLRVHRAHAGWREPWAVERFCRRLEKRGIDCRARVSKVGAKLGTRPDPAQGAWLWNMLARRTRDG